MLELSFTAFQKLDILITLFIYLFYVGCTCVLEITKSTKKRKEEEMGKIFPKMTKT